MHIRKQDAVRHCECSEPCGGLFSRSVLAMCKDLNPAQFHDAAAPFCYLGGILFKMVTWNFDACQPLTSGRQPRSAGGVPTQALAAPLHEIPELTIGKMTADIEHVCRGFQQKFHESRQQASARMHTLKRGSKSATSRPNNTPRFSPGNHTFA